MQTRMAQAAAAGDRMELGDAEGSTKPTPFVISIKICAKAQSTKLSYEDDLWGASSVATQGLASQIVSGALM